MADHSIPPARSTIGEWTVDRYQRLLTGQLIVTPIMLLMTAARLPTWLVVPLEIIWFIWLGWQVASRRGHRVESLVAGVMAGIATGLGTAVGRWFANEAALYGLNVLAETLLTGLVGALVVTMAMLIRQKLIFR
jgi:hypothetical protein